MPISAGSCNVMITHSLRLELTSIGKCYNERYAWYINMQEVNRHSYRLKCLIKIEDD